jgi:histone H2A
MSAAAPAKDTTKKPKTAEEEGPKKPKRHLGVHKDTKRYSDFRTYIHRALKQTHPKLAIGKAAITALNGIVLKVFSLYGPTIDSLLDSTASKTVLGKRAAGPSVIASATKLIMPGDLAKNMIEAANKANETWAASKKVKGTKTTLAKKSGLVFSPARVMKLLRTHVGAKRVSVRAAVELAACLEYITQEVLELAGKATMQDKRTRIKARDIKAGIISDEELEILFRGDVVASGGVRGHIHPDLLPAKSRKRAAAEGDVEPPKKKKKAAPKKKKAAPKKKKAVAHKKGGPPKRKVGGRRPRA